MTKSFAKSIRYCLSDKKELSAEQKEKLSLQDGLQHKDRAEVLVYNNCYGSIPELIEQFEDVQKLSRGVKKPGYHIFMRQAPEDRLKRGQWMEIAQVIAKEFNFENHQYVCVLHHDASQKHIHIIANRVGYDGKTVNDKFSHFRIAKLSQQLQKEYNLRQTPASRRHLSPEERLIPRQNQRQEKLRAAIKSALENTHSFAEFEKRMSEKGYQLHQKQAGIAFCEKQDKRIWTRGCDVGYPFKTIEKQIAQNLPPAQTKAKQQQEEQQQAQHLRQDISYSLHI